MEKIKSFGGFVLKVWLATFVIWSVAKLVEKTSPTLANWIKNPEDQIFGGG